MAADEPRDEQLLERFLEGDDNAFSVLVRRHEDKIFSLAYRMLGNRADALDATQETFVAAFRRARSFRGESSFGTWLFRIGINSARDVLRKRSRGAAPQELEDEGPEPASDELETQMTLRFDLSRALAALPEDHRTALLMHDLGGFGYQEIAAITRTNIGTVKSRISRARRKLALLLEQPLETHTSKD